MLNSFLNNYFGFNKQQRNGLFVLVITSLSLLIVRIVYPVFIQPDRIALLNLPLIERKPGNTSQASGPPVKNEFNTESTSLLFTFDPNTVSFEQLLQLGLKEKTAMVFLKFRNKGFVFKQKKDLQKVYGISDKLYAQLEPYILIEEGGSKQDHLIKPAARPAIQQAQAKLELNSADSASLVALNGIGPGYAKRILKYRALLGGYIAVEQLKEVYGVNEEFYEKVKSHFYADAHAVKKINLNTDDFKVLNKHPYLSYELTKTIFDWRRKTSINATNLKEILNDGPLYQKLIPYLSFE
jgi:competence protein ComEA